MNRGRDNREFGIRDVNALAEDEARVVGRSIVKAMKRLEWSMDFGRTSGVTGVSIGVGQGGRCAGNWMGKVRMGVLAPSFTQARH